MQNKRKMKKKKTCEIRMAEEHKYDLKILSPHCASE